MQLPVPYTRDLVLVGGGHAHALVLRSWGMDPLPGARVTVINPGPTAPYTGMLPGHVAGHYGRDDLEIDLVRLCRFAGARLILGSADGIDRERRQISIRGQGHITYDVASIDVGITAQMNLPGFAEHGIGAKPLDTYAARWRQFRAATAEGSTAPNVAVIGGGVAGCELAMAMAHALRAQGTKPKVTVIEAGPQISGMGDRARKMVLQEMSNLGIDLRCNARVSQIEAAQVLIDGQEPVPAALCVGAAGAFPHGWLAQTDLPLHEGFIEVGPDLGVLGDAQLFAVGDCAHMGFAPRPKAGVFAVRAAPILHANLRAALSGRDRKPFKPQKNYLKLISLGDKSAMAEKFGRTLKGPSLWHWKDRIDRAFMDKLSDLPSMGNAPVPDQAALGAREQMEAKPMCGGCGAKVGNGVLKGTLSHLPQGDGDIITGPGDDAAVLRQGDGFQVISTDHLRAFVLDHVQMARIAAVHALGDIWAMGARPQAALSQIILPPMSATLQARTLSDITTAAQKIFGDAGAQIVGGHTTTGAELTIGFTVTGTRETMPITVAGAQPGDALILTRPIGSGVILAGHMQGDAAGVDVVQVLDVMEQPQHREAEILQHANAMTDVTGFGLAGHAQAIAQASGVDVVLHLSDVPVYAGARALSQAGVASTLMPSNQDNVSMTGTQDAMLFDPQTAGGLLAAVPSEAAQDLIDALNQAGCTGYIIGEIVKGDGQLRVN